MRVFVLATVVFAAACTDSQPGVDGGPSAFDAGFTVYDGGRRSDAQTPDAGPLALPTDWHVDSVGYEVFVRSFQDSDGDGIGDLGGLTDRLDYLQNLGVDLLWLSPIMTGPSWHGYAVVDYRTVDPLYGSERDLVNLIEESHARGIRIILDLVLNHTSIEHPWFIEAATSTMADRRSWFVWSNNDPGWTQPWGTRTAWHAHASGWYYGVFSTRMPDLNYYDSSVRDEMLEVAEHWLSRGVDGFRIDGARYLMETGPGPLAQSDSADTHLLLQALRTRVDAVRPNALLVGEVWAETDRVVEYLGTSGPPELSIAFDFDGAGAAIDAVDQNRPDLFRASVERRTRSYPSLARVSPFLSNHDQDRVATRLGPDTLRLVAALNLTSPGTPWIYYGEEIGLRNAVGNGARRRPMQWGDSAGFTTGTPWAEQESVARTDSVAGHSEDASSLLATYQKLIETRRAHSALRRGQARFGSYQSSGSGILVEVLEYQEDQVLLVFNFDAIAHQVIVEAPGLPDALSFRDEMTGRTVQRTSSNEPLDVGSLPGYSASLFVSVP